MTKPAKNQTLVTTWGRFVLGAFVFAWLNVTAQPCLMATDLPAEPDLISGHAAHGMHQAAQIANDDAGPDDDCAHCPPTGPVSHEITCATLQDANCGGLPQSNIDARQAKLQLKDVPGFFAIAHAPPVPAEPPQTIATPQRCSNRPHLLAGPSLTILNCVFLI